MLINFFLINYRKVQNLTALVMRGVFYVGSFSVKINGTRASGNEAPILVVAPHSSLFDPIAIIFLGPPSVVAKAETASTPIFGSKYLQTPLMTFRS